MANILILGGGFGGLVTAEKLSRSLSGLHRITLVSPKDIFTFYPALVRLAFGDCEPEDISFDLLEKLHRLDVRFVQGEAIEIDFDSRNVRVAGDDFNGEINYDYLVIALGRRLATEKVPGFFEHAHHLLGISSAQKFGEAVNEFREGNIIVGLAPQAYLPVPVCETAFALARKFEREVKDGKIKISVLFPESVEKAFAGARLYKKLEKAFKNHQINLIRQFPVKEVRQKSLISYKGDSIDFDLLMLIPPFRGQSFLGEGDFLDEHDFIKVDNFLRVFNKEKVYAVGDVTDFEGPKLAYMASRQAQIAADNILAELSGSQPEELYRHEIAVIIDEGGADTIFLHYGIWDETLYHLKKGEAWSDLKNHQNELLEIFRKL